MKRALAPPCGDPAGRPRRRARGPAACAVALLLALGAWSPRTPAQGALTESQARAAAVLNFARYVEWPERAFAAKDAPLVFCLVGRDTLAGSSSMLEGKTLGGRPTQLRRVLGTDELRGCHVLYLPDTEDRRLAPMLRASAGEPVLTIGESGGFVDAGGAIALSIEDGRIRFDISRPALEAAHLRASVNLLRLARPARGS